MLEYMNLNKTQIDDLPRETTIFVSCISPIEVHGPHLPVGTDVMVAGEVMKRLVAAKKGYAYVHLPDLPLGAQPVPTSGSLPVKRKVLMSILYHWGCKLKEMGFKYWVVFDNHGGFTHQLAFSEASKKLIKKQFYLINPFLHIYMDMISNNKEIGLPSGKNGNIEDAHAGTNETSLMLAADPAKIAEFSHLKKYKPIKTSKGKLLRTIGNECIGATVDWIEDKNHPNYVGDPSIANKEAGDKMIAFHVKKSEVLLNQALNSEYHPPKLFNPIIRLLLKILPEW